MFFVKRLFACLCFILCAAPAFADNHIEYYKHNGSTMKVVWDQEAGEFFTMYYDQPRPGLGVIRGTVLMEGSYPANGILYVTARVFKRGCPPAKYRLTGRFDDSGNFTVKGKAPVRRGCRVVGYEWNHNSHLFFSKGK